LKRVNNRLGYRWLTQDLNRRLPTCLSETGYSGWFRLFQTHRWWIHRFIAVPTLLDVSIATVSK
jgi:hypothetical protein